ncbi:MAG: plastocyanin/azurin family copper-binding protein [Candidatus Krumholzibacteria bacterium]|nr:plastocyanin/azurin family copper-binding protein [Candidatus Krumholzibacteria bacterium]
MRICGRLLTLVAAALSGLLACTDMGDPVATPPGGGNGDPVASRFVVSVQDNLFVPDSLAIAPGDTVVWVNEGFLIHTSTSGSACGPNGDGAWDSGNLLPGDSFAHVFPTSGDFPYYCIPHCLLGMTGHVAVGP